MRSMATRWAACCWRRPWAWPGTRRFPATKATRRASAWRARPSAAAPVEAVNGTSGKVILYTTCYGNRNLPAMVEDLVAVFRHNGITVQLAGSEQCCGMPKLELGDLESVARAKEANVPELARWVAEGWDIVAPVPSCVLMFKQELPLMFPGDPQVQAVGAGLLRSLQLPAPAPQGRQAPHRLRASPWARCPTTCPATCGCRTSA